MQKCSENKCFLISFFHQFEPFLLFLFLSFLHHNSIPKPEDRYQKRKKGGGKIIPKPHVILSIALFKRRFPLK